MATYVNLAASAKIKSLKMIINDHDKMLREASGDMSITDAVRLLVTGYHRTKRDEAKAELKEFMGLPENLERLVPSGEPFLSFSDV